MPTWTSVDASWDRLRAALRQAQGLDPEMAAELRARADEPDPDRA